MDSVLSPTTLDVEPSIAQVLATKMKRRGTGTYRPRSEADVLPLLQKFVSSQPGFAQHRVEGVGRLAGGASKEQFYFSLIGPESSERLVLRMDPPASVVETSRIREFEALRAFENIVPVPRAIWMDADGDHFGTPALITSFVDGVTKPAGAPGGNVSGLGINVGTQWREVLSDPFMQHMVAIHGFDWRKAHMPSYSIPDADPHQAARRQIDWWTQVWMEDAVDPHPMLPRVEN